jgi:hypothetical protein
MGINKSVYFLATILFACLPLYGVQAAPTPPNHTASANTWTITTTYLSYTTHGNIAATMDYLYVGSLATTTFFSNLINFNPTNVAFDYQGGAFCDYSDYVVACAGNLTRLHITFDYNVFTNWSDPNFYTHYQFNSNPAIDMTYTVQYSSQFTFVSADPTPASQASGQVSWFSPGATTINGKVTFVDPALLPKKFYLPVIQR